LAFSRKMWPSIGIPDARACWYQANRTLSSSRKVDSLPVFLFLQDLSHLSICSRIFLFFATMQFNVDGSNPRLLLCRSVYQSDSSPLLQ
jgi:hypothetical protein